MREPKPEWLVALRALCGADSDLRFNVAAHRWEFVLQGADGIPRSQFWGRFYVQHANGTRTPLTPDPVTGLHAFRELDDDGMREALDNLERTFVGNRFDGAGTTRREVLRRWRFNRDLLESKYQRAGEAFADLAAERGHRLREAPMVPVQIQIASTLGSKA